MICSASELDLWDDHAGILKLSDETKLGSDFSKYTTLLIPYGKLVLLQIGGLYVTFRNR